MAQHGKRMGKEMGSGGKWAKEVSTGWTLKAQI